MKILISTDIQLTPDQMADLARKVHDWWSDEGTRPVGALFGPGVHAILIRPDLTTEWLCAHAHGSAVAA